MNDRRLLVRSRRWAKLGRAAAAMLGGLLIGGCGAGFTAQSIAVRPNAGAAQDGSLRINNIWVVVDPATGNAEVIGATANTGRIADTLTKVTAGGVPASIHPASPEAAAAALPVRGVTMLPDAMVLDGGSAVSFGRAGGPEFELRGGTFRPGHMTRVALDFERAGPVSMNAQIMPNTGLFAGYDPNGPNPAPAPAPAHTRTAAAGSPTAAATASATPHSTGP